MTDEETGVSRKVYFFRFEHFHLFKDILSGAFQRIENLPFEDGGRYQRDPSNKSRLCVFPDRLDYPLQLRFGRTRRDLLPDIERGGQLKTLELREDEGLIDVCHIIIFDDGYVAAELNHDGPRLAKLGLYLFEKGNNLPSAPVFLPLFERDIVEVIAGLDNIRVLEVDVPPDSVELLREADDNLAAAVEASARAGASKKIGLTLTADNGLSPLRLLTETLASIIKARPLARKSFKTLKATGYINGSSVARYVDILEEKLVSGEIFPRNSPRSRSIDSDQAYALIEQAYKARRDRFAAAAVGNELW
jgi:hypothetical protein